MTVQCLHGGDRMPKPAFAQTDRDLGVHSANCHIPKSKDSVNTSACLLLHFLHDEYTCVKEALRTVCDAIGFPSAELGAWLAHAFIPASFC